MSTYFFLRIGIVLIAFLGWIIYQKKVNKKTWIDLKKDILLISIYIIVSGFIFYFLLN